MNIHYVYEGEIKRVKKFVDSFETTPFTETDYRKLSKEGYFYVVTRGDVILGVIIGYLRGSIGELLLLVVNPAHIKQGVKTQLMRYFEQELKSRGCKQIEFLCPVAEKSSFSRLGYKRQGSYVGLAKKL